ncbi:MAG: TIGR02710 family CRISPR-associated protein [Spartobacteria bacterium]|nr:TIGR02710 family CRISPR-associated protein [Spartobacteria bacterium]
MTDKEPEHVLIASVGGSPAPIVKTICDKKPKAVIFFVSKDSCDQVFDNIMPAVSARLGYFIRHQLVVTDDEQDLGVCVFKLLEEVPKELAKLGISLKWPNLIGYTAGTKTMSAALVWASARFDCEYVYVGGTQRDKNGLGVVIDGSEQLVELRNPWNQIGWFETRTAIELFNRGQYANALQLIQSLCHKVNDEKALRTLTFIRDAFEAYHAWDIFDFKKAGGTLNKVVREAKTMAYYAQHILPGLQSFCEKLPENLERLSAIKGGNVTEDMAMDLLANALRRSEMEGKYEDAVARCYSAFEKMAKARLKTRYGIDNSCAKPEQIPPALRDVFVNKYSAEEESTTTLKFGLKASYLLLNALNDEMGTRYMTYEKEVSNALGVRNSSILGHGFKAVTQKDFATLFDLILQISGQTRTSLVVFPSFELDG